MGISATQLDEVTVHNRTQQLRALVEPHDQANSAAISSNDKLTLTVGSRDTGTGVINFDIVGKNMSVDHNDAIITALLSNVELARATGDVLVPHHVGTSHDTVGQLVIRNQATDASTSPPAVGLPAMTVQLVTVYARLLTIKVLDKFGGEIGDLYQGSEISEPLGPQESYITINQPLSSSSTYVDVVGIQVGTTFVSVGSDEARDWPMASKIPLGNACESPTQFFGVKVDRFGLDPAIANRTVTICGDGHSVTSPPISITISWPN